MDDKDLEKDQKQAEKDEASQKTAHVAGKAAATYFGGGVGGKIYDAASKTKVGQDIEKVAGKSLQRKPGMNKAMEGLNKSGALDAADKGLDLAGGDAASTGATSNPLPNSSKSSSGSSNSVSSLLNSKSQGQSDGESLEDHSYASKIFSFLWQHKTKVIPVIGGFLLLFFFIILIIAIVGSPVAVVSDFFSGIIDSVIGFFSEDEKKHEQEYYETLKEVQTDINRKYGVCVDVNLITAALTINVSADDYLEDGQQIVTDGEDNPDYDPYAENAEEPTINVDYKLMKKQIKLLANMQIQRNKYGWDKSLIDANGSHCHEGSGVEEVLVTADTVDNFVEDGFILFRENGMDSSTPELIAQHDLTGFAAFITKKSNEERNYAYYLYRPPFVYEEKKDSSGNVVSTERKCDYKLPGEKAVLSIGDLGTREDSVFYWNLVNSFIPEYYDEYLPDTEPERTERVKEMAEEIYLLYKDIGPSQTCTISYVGPSSLCPDGITVDGVGTIDLEDYVAGVVSNEAYCSEGMEALKAQAVAARTYALHSTDYCQKPIANSTSAQTFTQNVNDRAREATKATMGEVLTYDGDIFSSQYDSFCYDDDDCPDATYSGGSYTVTYTKVPAGGQHTVTLSDSDQFGRITHGQGHARGMSQLVSYQLADEGKSYQEILYYFYSDGVSITYVPPVGGSGKEVVDGTVQEKLEYLFPSGLPSSDSEARSYMQKVEFNVVDINGNRSTKRATVHKALAQDFVDIMNQIANSGFPIKDVGCYNWRSAAGSSSRSHHSYGVACDLNSNENYMIKNGQILAGSYWKPGVDPYSFPADGVVVRTFAKYGWTWGGSWTSSKDYMHFSFTGY